MPLPQRNPLPQLIPARVRHVKECVEQRMWQSSVELQVFRSQEQQEAITFELATKLSMEPLHPGTHFGHGGDNWTQFWLRTEIPPASSAERGRRHLRWRSQGETTVWIDGGPWAGLDIAHRECPLPDHACALWLECCSWQTGIWIAMAEVEPIGPHGIRFDGAQLAVRNLKAWECHSDLDAIVQMMEAALRHESDLKLALTNGYSRALESVAPRLRMLLHELDGLCDVWQQTQDLDALRVACGEFLERWPAEYWQPTAAICGHAHIDLVWLWPESATRKKIVHTFATAMRLMERYPEMIFTQSMPAAYRMLEQESPEIMAQVKSHIDGGRWEVLGAFEVEPDTNLPGGEALARSIQLGQRKIAELTGDISPTAWIPDVFGYNQCLPQIMALGGVRYFYTTKMTWSNVTKFPYTSFRWRGADGTEILSHLCTTGYNGEVELNAHEQAMSEHRQAAIHAELLLPIGYGDGGGGPTELHVERARRFEDLSGSPRTRWTRVDQFFARLDEVRDRLPVYQGELYLETHRGTYTTQSEFKRLYRLAEQGLQVHEAARVAIDGGPLPDEAWLRVLFAHFHDAIPGSSIQEVYADLTPELEAIGSEQFEHARQCLASPTPSVRADRSLHAFNPLPYARTAVVDHENGVSQVVLPALGSAALANQKSVIGPIEEASPHELRHERLTARFDTAGQLVELICDGQPISLDSAPGFVLATDHPAAFDAWDIDHHALRLATRVADLLVLRVAEHSPVRAVLESEPVAVGAKSELRLRYILEAGSTHLKIEPTVHWREDRQLLRYVVPTHYKGRHARFGCPFGAIERPQLPGREADEAMWEVPGSRWAAVQIDGGQDGLAILAASKLGYAARDGVLSISLLRAPKWPDAAADMGSHTMPFALGRLQLRTTETDMSSSMAADALFSVPLIYEGEPVVAKFDWRSLGSVNASWCAPSAGEAGAYFVRLHETAGQAGSAHLQLRHPAVKAELIDLLERPLATLNLEPSGAVAIPYRPWQILTVRISGDDV